MAPVDPRRRAIGRLAVLGLGSVPALSLLSGQAAAHGAIGPVRPQLRLPDVPVLRHDGARLSLAALLRGKVTALQLMFTGCSTTCGLQGATFAALQQRLPPQWHTRIQLLSLSIDPLADNAAALNAWRQRFGAATGWNAVAPTVAALDPLRAALQQSASPDAHSTQVHLFNREGLLAWRTGELPGAPEIARLLVAADAADGG